MNFKRNITRLNKFKEEMEKYKHLEDKNIKPILDWVKSRQKKIRSSSKIINLILLYFF